MLQLYTGHTLNPFKKSKSSINIRFPCCKPIPGMENIFYHLNCQKSLVVQIYSENLNLIKFSISIPWQ